MEMKPEHNVDCCCSERLRVSSRVAAVYWWCWCYSLKDLAAFIKEVDTELAKPLVEGDYEALVNIIGILMRIKERQMATDEMFEPLKQSIELLKIYNQELPDEVYQHLQVQYTHNTLHKYYHLQMSRLAESQKFH